eukprot:CAMPEP_0113894910 /NCGR_PEP_ID=MMETSP0780_2-20120614/17026_1 /TAXON_ID=652834 /ORGANISM="Palpitomonas bilix" /LENGTH=1146 /DNA_ID=CAMNT_0000885595 /DNA_START=199 /DNA_END=3639 /DNA_ORIENTATION=- /assembly_acc=CAM_ASM_000599
MSIRAMRQPLLPSAALQYGNTEALTGGPPKAPEANEIVEYARYIGMDPVKDVDLLWIAEEALTAALPDDWEEHFDAEGNVFYYNKISHVSSWDHPLDSYYKALFQKLKKAMRENKAADKVNNAAVKVQSLYRGHLARRLYQVLLVEELERRAAIAVQAAFRGLQGRKQAAQRRREAAIEYLEDQALKIQCLFRGHMGRRVAAGKRAERQAENEQLAALILQCWYRRHLAKERADFLRRRNWVARLSARVAYIQAAVRRVLTTKDYIESLQQAKEEKVRAAREYERRLGKGVHRHARTIQMAYRRFQLSLRVEMRVRKKEYSTVEIQRMGRGMLARKERRMMIQLRAIRVVQRLTRGFLGRRKVMRVREKVEAEQREAAARHIQRVARGRQGRKEAEVKRTEAQEQRRRTHAATVIQSFGRMIHSKKVVKKLRRLRDVELRRARMCTKIQSVYRGYLVRRTGLGPHYRHRRRAAVKIQSAYKAYRTRKAHTRRLRDSAEKELRGMQKECATEIQRIARGYLARRWTRAMVSLVLDNVKAPAYDVQRVRERNEREKMQVAWALKDVAAEKIQSAFRGYMGRTKARSKRNEVRAEFVRMNTAATSIQRSYRGHVAREVVKMMKAVQLAAKKEKLRKRLEQKSQKSMGASMMKKPQPPPQPQPQRVQPPPAQPEPPVVPPLSTSKVEKNEERKQSLPRVPLSPAASAMGFNGESAASVSSSSKKESEREKERGGQSKRDEGESLPRISARPSHTSSHVELSPAVGVLEVRSEVGEGDDQVEKIPSIEVMLGKEESDGGKKLKNAGGGKKKPKKAAGKSAPSASATAPPSSRQVEKEKDAAKKRVPSPPTEPPKKKKAPKRHAAGGSLPTTLAPRPPQKPSHREVSGGGVGGGRKLREAWGEQSRVGAAAMECVDETPGQAPPPRLSMHDRKDIEEEVLREGGGSGRGGAGGGKGKKSARGGGEGGDSKRSSRVESESDDENGKNSNEVSTYGKGGSSKKSAKGRGGLEGVEEDDDELPDALKKKAKAMTVDEAKNRHQREVDGALQEQSAVKMQSLYRGHRARRQVSSKKKNAGDNRQQEKSAVAIQRTFRGHQSRRKTTSLRKQREGEAEQTEKEYLDAIQKEMKVMGEIYETATGIASTSEGGTTVGA